MTTITPPPARPTHPFFAALNYKPAAWEAQALCRRFPNESEAWLEGKDGSEDALAICRTSCPVRKQCLDDALTEEATAGVTKVFTIRGGVRATDRIRLVRALRAARADVAAEVAA